VIDGDHEPVLIHVIHHPPEICAVIRTPLENVVLPLVDHLVGQRGGQCCFAPTAFLIQLAEKRQ